MPIAIQMVLLILALVFLTVGALMLFAPARYPNLYIGFLNESVMRRQHTEPDRMLAIRTQGLGFVAGGAFFAYFVWALH